MSAEILVMPRSRTMWRGHADVLRQELQSMAAALASLSRQAAESAVLEMPRITAGAWTLDTSRLELRGHEQTISLTASQTKLLQALMERPGQGLSRLALLRLLNGGTGSDLQLHNVDAHMARLRRRLGAAAAQIQVIRGIGFCWRAQ